MRFIRKAGAPAEKSPKRLHVEPAELARKLIKEMDDHTVSRGEHVWARNRYLIYLCTEDYEKLAPRAPQLIAELTGKLAKHIRDRDYLLQGDLTVEMVLDPDLELGYFGILAQRAYGKKPAPEAAPESSAGLVAPPAQPAAPAAAAAAVASQAAAAPADAGGAPPVRPAPAPGPAAAALAAGAAAEAADMGIPAGTEVLAAQQAKELGLAHRVIVVTSGDQVREFTQSRVVLGRSREADYRIDDPNVSRKHAAIYWNNDRLMIEDLGSTNGTMVNGYPVTNTVLRPRDVVAIGESRLTVESK